jgi:VWFA-related protein
MIHRPEFRGRPVLWRVLLLVSVGVMASVVVRAQQQPTFRATVELIAVDVQVVDNDGAPLSHLRPESFEVTIDGRRHKVVSADFVRHSVSDLANGPARSTPSGPVASNQWPTDGPGRTFMLAVDLGSFEIGQSRGVAAAARGFIDKLLPNDQVGLYTFPTGPWVHPSTDRTELRHQLDGIVGNRQAIQSQFHLTPSEVVDITAEMSALASRGAPAAPRAGQAPSALNGDESETIRRVQLRECGDAADFRCVEAIEVEASAMAFVYEGLVVQGLDGLSNLMNSMSELPGRKTMIVFSAGMPMSDRVGGRPNPGDQARTLGEQAARTNTIIYALHIDASYLQTYAAENRRSNRPVSLERESTMLGRLLDQFAGASGGTLMRVLVGSGEGSLDRVLRETSAYYLLGVEPTQADHDGRTHALKVTVKERNATVRSRTFVLLPKPRL